MIKSVISTIPTYFLSVFKMPMGVAKKIEKLQMGFLWGDGVIKRKLHAVSWGEVCKRKSKGGLGIGRILDKNKAMMVKWIWRFSKEDQSLWRRGICSKYKIDESLLSWDWIGRKYASFFVKSMQELLKAGTRSAVVIKEGFVPVIGRGNRLQLWTNILVEGKPLKVAFPRCFTLVVHKIGVMQNFGNWWVRIGCGMSKLVGLFLIGKGINGDVF